MSKSAVPAAMRVKELKAQMDQYEEWPHASAPLNVARPDDATLILTLPEEARSRYEITTPETITLTLPQASLLSGRTVVAEPRLVGVQDKSVAVGGGKAALQLPPWSVSILKVLQ